MTRFQPARRVYGSLQSLLTFNRRLPYAVRDSMYRALCAGMSARLGTADFSPRIEELVAQLRSEGYLRNIRDLSVRELEEMTRALGAMTPIVFDDGYGRRDKAAFSNKDLAASYPFLAVATDDEVVRLVARYLGGPPLIHAIVVWDVDAESAQQNEMFYHVDYHGHRCVKMFHYLSDVEAGGGHHVYVAGSHTEPAFDRLIAACDNEKQHLRTQIESNRRYQGNFVLNSDVIDRHLRAHLIEFFGKAGTSFIEDTRGLHRGTPVSNGTCRRAMKVLYTVLDSYKDGIEPSPDTRAFERRLAETAIDKRVFRRLCSKIVDLRSIR